MHVQTCQNPVTISYNRSAAIAFATRLMQLQSVSCYHFRCWLHSQTAFNFLFNPIFAHRREMQNFILIHLMQICTKT